MALYRVGRIINLRIYLKENGWRKRAGNGECGGVCAGAFGGVLEGEEGRRGAQEYADQRLFGQQGNKSRIGQNTQNKRNKAPLHQQTHKISYRIPQ